jgi:hypothetical protein
MTIEIPGEVCLESGLSHGDPGLGVGWMQARDECLMFWARQALMDGRDHSCDVTSEQSSGIEPQTREDFATENSMRVWHEPLVLPAA